MYPDLVGKIHIHKDVEKYIYNGANLMWPGIKNIEGTFKKDEVRCIVNSENIFVAVGAMSCSSEEYKKLASNP